MVERTQSEEVIWYGGRKLATVPITVSSKRVVKLMEDDYIELHFALAEAVHFPVGAYCDDELFGRFYVTEEQMPKYDNGAYSYELKMEAWYRAWKLKLFMMTAVNIESGSEFRKEADWTLTNTLREQMREVLVNLQLCGYVPRSINFRNGDADLDKYLSIKEDDMPSYSQSLTMSYSSVDILTAIGNLADTWNCEWWVTGTEEGFVIHFGRCANGNAVKLSIGDNIETIDANDDTSEKGRKLFVFGGEENIPNTYRKELKLTMANCYGVASFDAAYDGEILPFAATKDEKGNITDGLLPYGSEVRIRLKDNHGVGQTFEVKASEDNETRLYSEFYKRFPTVTSPLTMLDGYRVTAAALMEKGEKSESILFLSEDEAARYAALVEDGYTTTALRVVCEVCKKQYIGGEWKTVGWQEYPLTHKEWYEVTKHTPVMFSLEADGHGAYLAYGDFTLRDGNYSWRLAMPEKNNYTNTYEGKKSAYLTTQDKPENVPLHPSFSEIVTPYDYTLTVATEENVRHITDIDVYAETKEGGDYGRDIPLTSLEEEKEYFDSYRPLIKGTGLTLFEWRQYAEESEGLLVWHEGDGTFILDPNGSGREIVLTYSKDGLYGEWLDITDGWHSFTAEVDDLAKTAWSVDTVYFTKVGGYKYRYYTTPTWETDLQEDNKGGLFDYTYKNVETSRYHRSDIITYNGCGEIVRNTFSEIEATAPMQRPKVSVHIRTVEGASYAIVKLTADMGLQKTRSTDFLRGEKLSDSPLRLYTLTTSARVEMSSTSVEMQLETEEVKAEADSVFLAYGACTPALFLRAEVEYYDAAGERILLDGNITGDGFIKVSADTVDAPTFQFTWRYGSYLLRAKIFNLDSQANGRAFFLYDKNAGLDETAIHDGAEFILESDEDYAVPYKYYTSAIDDPSSIYSIGSKRLQLPVFRNDEYNTYKGRYNLSTVISNSGETWITRGDWAYSNGCIVPLEHINDSNAKELRELCIIKEEIYPTAKLLVKSVRTTDEQEKDEVEGESKANAVTWQWKQYHVTVMQPDGTDIKFSQKYIRENSEKLKMRFLVPEDVKEWADSGTLVCDFNDIRKNCKLAGMTFEDEFNDKIGEYTQDHALARNTDYGAKLPNDVLYPSVYDPVTLVNIDVRTLKGMKVIAAAEYALLDYAFEYASALNEGNFTFECGMMSDFLDGTDILGRNVVVSLEALKQPKITRVIGYEMKLDIPYDSPTLTCGETEAYSRLKQLEKGVRTLTEKKITNNYYTSGLSRSEFGDGYTMVIDLAKGGTIAPKETETVKIYVYDALDNDVTKNFTDISVSRNSGDAPSDAVWNAMHIRVDNPFELTFNDLNIDGINTTAAEFIVTARDGANETSNTMDFYI